MERVLGLIYQDMADFETNFILNMIGIYSDLEVTIIAEEMKPVTGKSGITYLPHMTISEALELDDVEGLVIPGGWNDTQSPELTELINKIHQNKKLLSAICRGPSYLARAGVLGTKSYTTTYSPKLVEKLGVKDPFDRNNYKDVGVVRDDNVITAKDVSFIDFAIEILDYFEFFDDSEEKDEFRNQFKG